MLATTATETLAAFDIIARAASAQLGGRTAGSDSFAAINQLNAAKATANLGKIQHELVAAYTRLRDEPAIARLVIADEDDRRETLYICRNSTVSCGVPLCSSLAPKGRLASLPVGGWASINLPGGTKHLEVLERAVFKPDWRGGQWDALHAVVQTEAIGPLSIGSLRGLLTQAGWSEDALDLLERQLAEEDEAANVVEGLKRSVLTAMQLRDQPILDRFQDDIFRMPLDRQLVILGPPGTGKTTTLVRRLRQKIDLEFLTDDERTLAEQGGSALPHAQSWLMFTPTELLKHYVREAFAREGVAAPDARIRTWDEHRRDLARRHLPLLKSSAGGTLQLNEAAEVLTEQALRDQIAWFEDFDTYQKSMFLQQLRAQAQVMADGRDAQAQRLGQRIAAVLDNAGPRATAALAGIAGLLDDLRRELNRLLDSATEQLRRPLALHLRTDPTLLDDLARLLAGLEGDDGDDEEIDDGEDEDDGALPGTRRAAQAAFMRALRAAAVAQVRGRRVGRTSRNGRILQWLAERGVPLPDLQPVGEIVAVQRAARQVLRAPAAFVRGVPGRYRAFRRERQAQGRWYGGPELPAREVTPLELDAILLALLRNARLLLDDGTLLRRLGDSVPTILSDVTRLQRNQILVDEATDFSPVQLACMAALASPWTDSFFACGDFNQRLTRWGSRSTEHMEWIFPAMEFRLIDISYRQSERLNALAALLADDDAPAASRTPEHLDNPGVPPVLGLDLGDGERLVAWLAARIGEIEGTLKQLPTVAVLVNDAATMQALAPRLNAALASSNIRAVACPDGQVMGQGNDVRVFEVEHIKGLEFEAVFFVDVDRLEAGGPDLFRRYLYVGATRAATYLGMTASTAAAPDSLGAALPMFAQHWRS